MSDIPLKMSIHRLLTKAAFPVEEFVPFFHTLVLGIFRLTKQISLVALISVHQTRQ